MDILISTNMYPACDTERVFALTDAFAEEHIGVEVFSMFHDPCFAEVLARSMDRLKWLPVSFHGPYVQTEHSDPKGSEGYERSMGFYRAMLLYAQALHSRYAVFHHNNCRITEEERERRLVAAEENLREIKELSARVQVPVAVENVGVKVLGNVLLDEDAFVKRCLAADDPVLIDIGHAHANGWNLRRVMEQLADKIVAYHVHNNDGCHDSHQRIYRGTLDFDCFLADVRELTPTADLVLEYAQDVADDEDGIREDIKRLVEFRRTIEG